MMIMNAHSVISLRRVLELSANFTYRSSRCIGKPLGGFFNFRSNYPFHRGAVSSEYLRFITSPGGNGDQDAGQTFVAKIVSRRASFLFCYRSKRGSFILPFISRRSRRLETPTISRPLSNFRMIFRCLRSPRTELSLSPSFAMSINFSLSLSPYLFPYAIDRRSQLTRSYISFLVSTFNSHRSIYRIYSYLYIYM